MVSLSQPNGLRKRPELKRLQYVQEEIYRQLHLLIPDEFAFHDYLVSRVYLVPPTLRTGRFSSGTGTRLFYA